MVEVRLAQAAELEELIELLYQIERHYFGDLAVDRGEHAARVRRQFFQPEGAMRVVLARDAGRPVGVAVFTILFPAQGMTGQLFLKDLFTVAEARGRGVATALLRFLARYALSHDCSRVDWTAETDNPKALNYYDQLGVPRLAEKVYYRLMGDRLRALAEADPAAEAGR